MPLEMASNNAKTSSLFHDISQERASSQSTHHLEAGMFSSILVHGSHLVVNDIPKG
jgi:hypothetical protein